MFKVKSITRYLALPICLLYLIGCKGEEDQQAVDKLKEKEKQILTEEKDSVEKLKTEMDQMEDSLQKNYQQVLAEKENLEKRRAEIEGKEKEIIEQKRQEKLQALQTEKKMLENNLTAIGDTIASITSKLSELNKKREAFTKEGEFVKVTEKKAEEELVTGIAEIDAAIKSLKEEKSNEQKKLDLIEKKTDLSNGKISVLMKELDLYEAERNNLFMEEDVQGEIKQLDEKIKQINEDVAAEKNKIIELNLARQLANNKIQSLENQISDYGKEYKTEHEKKNGLDRYVQKETKRLNAELALIEERKKQLSEDWKKWAAESEKIQNKISGYDSEIGLLKGKEISKVVSELADLEKSEVDLLKQETSQLQKEQKKTDTIKTVTDEGKLKELRKKVSEEKSKIAGSEEKLAKEKQQLMEKKQEATQERAKRLHSWPLTILIIIGLVVVGLVALFIIGKNIRSKKKTT